MSPLSWDCLQGTQARGGGKVQFGSSLSLNGLKIAVGKCTLSLYNLREVLSPPGPSLPTETVNMTALQGDLWRFLLFFFMAKRMKNRGILPRNVVRSPSFEGFFVKAKVLTRKIYSTLSENLGFLQEIHREITYLKEELMR